MGVDIKDCGANSGYTNDIISIDSSSSSGSSTEITSSTSQTSSSLMSFADTTSVSSTLVETSAVSFFDDSFTTPTVLILPTTALPPSDNLGDLGGDLVTITITVTVYGTDLPVLPTNLPRDILRCL